MSYYLFQLKILILFAIHTTYHYPLIFFSRFKYLQLIRKLYSNLLFFPLLLLDQVPFKMLPAIREITCIKYIILESNRKCAKGLIFKFYFVHCCTKLYFSCIVSTYIDCILPVMNDMQNVLKIIIFFRFEMK